MWENSGMRGAGRGASIKHAANRALYRYWDRLRGNRPAPMRHEVEPSELGSMLSDVFILEASTDRSYTYRLAGTRVCGYFGRELKGENWLEGWSPRSREALSTLLRAIVNEGTGALVSYGAVSVQGRVCPFETMLLPLVSRGNGYARILGATMPLDEPFWLGADHIASVDLTDARVIWPNNSRHFRPPERKDDVVAPFPLARRGHLALYDGGRSD